MFNIKNISSGMWKFLIFLIILSFGFIYASNGKQEYYAFAIVGFGIIIFILGSTYNKEYVELRTEKEARDIADKYIKNKIKMQNDEFNITLADGEIHYDCFKKHDEREGLITPYYEIGFHIHPKFKTYAEYYSIEVHGLRENLEVIGLNPLNHPYAGDRLRVKYILVDFSEAKKFHAASLMVYQHNKEEGFNV